MRYKYNNNAKGMALVIILALVMAIVVIGLGFIVRGDTELLCGQNMELAADVDYLAESGLEHAKGLIMYPQDLATEYFTGATAQQLVSGDDYYDVSVTKLSELNWRITSLGYRQIGGNRTAQNSLTANLRLDPAIAFWSGTSVSLSPVMSITGDVYCNGVLTNSGSINGDCFADLPIGGTGTITGQKKDKTALDINKPAIDYNRLITNPLKETIPSPLNNKNLPLSSSTEVCYISGDLEIKSNVIINGCLAVDGNLTITGSSNVITAKKNVPAIYVSGNLIIKKNAGLDCNGLVFVDGRIEIPIYDRAVKVTGSLFTDEGIRHLVADDSNSGNNGDGVINGNCAWVAGKVHGAINFDGDGDFIDIGFPMPAITNRITVAAWIKVTAFDKPYQAIVTKGDTRWRLQRYSDTDHIEFACTGVTGGDIHGSRNVNDGQWHHIAGVYDGIDNRILLYVDGVEEVNQFANGSISTNSAPVYIGENYEEPGRYFNGQIDEVRIYKEALSMVDIVSIIAGGSPSPGDLVGYWSMDWGNCSTTITAAPTKASIYHWPSGSKNRWSPAAGAFYKSITRNP
jgi:hypothetical protein